MKYGFFSASELQTAKPRLAHSAHCGACGLARQCLHPCMRYRGMGLHKILVVGEAPGRHEDEAGEQFVGRAGQRLQYELRRCGIHLNRDCWKTNAVRCYPQDGKTPDSKTIAYCRPALFREIEQLHPQKILLLGRVAAESVLGHLWGAGGKYPLLTWTAWNIPHRELNAWISVHYHPSHLNRQGDPLLNLLFRRELKKSLSLKGRPWKKTPTKLEDQVELIYTHRLVPKVLQRFKGTIAFDYETNCLKPEYEQAEIVSCAVSGMTKKGRRTYAFPWKGAAIGAMSSLLVNSNIKKIASNAKFEERWTRQVLQHGVRGWIWDTMLAAHVLNNASGTTGLKFQAFALLGQPAYDRHIKSYLEPPRNVRLNRIRELSWKDILLYNGMDSLVTYDVATVQMNQMDIKK